MLNIETKIETKSAILRELTISVKPDSIDAYIEKQYATIQKTAKVKGFRQGKVPMALVKKVYAQDVKSDAVSKIVNDSYFQALQEHKLTAVGSPEIEAKSGLELDGQPLTFVAKVEIFPEIEMKDVSKIKLNRLSTEVTEVDVEKSLDNLRENYADLVPDEANAGPAKDGNQVVVSFHGTVDGQPLDSLKSENRVIELGARQYLEQFENQIIGMKKGQTKDFDVEFPKEFTDPGLAGKTAKFTVTLHEFKKKVLPQLDDEFAKNFKEESVNALRSGVRKQLEADRKRESEEKLKEGLLEELNKMHDFEVPQAMIQTQIQYLIGENAQYLKRQGFTEKMVRDYLEKNREYLTARAREQVKASLLLDRVSQDQGIKIENADLEHEFSKMAENMKVAAAEIQSYYESDADALKRLKYRLREDRTIEYLYGKVKIS